jgi:hypothetical protein
MSTREIAFAFDGITTDLVGVIRYPSKLQNVSKSERVGLL